MLFKTFVFAVLATAVAATPLAVRDSKKEVRGGFTSDVIITAGDVVEPENERH